MKISESTNHNYKIIKFMVDFIVQSMPTRIPSDESVSVSMSLENLQSNGKKQNVDSETMSQIINFFKTLETLKLHNLESGVKDTTMGYLGNYGRNFSLGINISGLMGDSEAKTKNDILNYKGSKSINNFKSILGHELRHLMQNNEYSSKLKAPNDVGYNYDTDPIEIDASFMEALLDHDIDSYDNIQQYVNDVIDTLKAKKPLSSKNKGFYYKKIAKFYTLYKNGDSKIHSLKDRFESHKNKKIEQFLNAFDQALEKINKDFSDKLEKDYKELGSIPKDDLQQYYINIEKPTAIRSIIVGILNRSQETIKDSNAHLVVASIAYANAVRNIPHISYVIRKIYNASEKDIGIGDTIEYIEDNGYFKKAPGYVRPILNALKEYRYKDFHENS